MNASLFRSWHGAVAAALAAAMLLWAVLLGRPLGRTVDADRLFLLTSGFVALGLYVVLWLYGTRRAAHRLRSSPEFAMAADAADLEFVHAALADLRNRALAGQLTDPREAARLVDAALADAGVDRAARADVHLTGDGRTLHIGVRWRQPIGRLAAWLHAHFYYGLAAAVVVLLHGGGAFGSPMALALNGLSLLVIGSGLVGFAAWAFGPSWLTAAERDLSVEKAFVLRDHYARKVEGMLRDPDGLQPALAVGAAASALADLRRGGRAAATAAAAFVAAVPEDARTAARDLAALVQQGQRVEVVAADLLRRRRMLFAWRLVHLPGAWLLLLFSAVHGLSVWFY